MAARKRPLGAVAARYPGMSLPADRREDRWLQMMRPRRAKTRAASSYSSVSLTMGGRLPQWEPPLVHGRTPHGAGRRSALVSCARARARGLMGYLRRRTHAPRYTELRLPFTFGEARGRHVGAGRGCARAECRTIPVADDFVASSFGRSDVGRVPLRRSWRRCLCGTPRDQDCHYRNGKPHVNTPKKITVILPPERIYAQHRTTNGVARRNGSAISGHSRDARHPLIAKHCSMKCALAKYDEALRYTPNWKPPRDARDVAKQKV
jgi:hypothetical protein